MTTEASAGSSAREPELLGQTVVLIGGSAGIGLETARRARSEGADVILTGRDPERLGQAALDVDARSTAAFDANDAAALKQFFDGLPDPIDHVLVTAGGPHYVPLLEMESADVRDALSDHVVLGLEVPAEVDLGTGDLVLVVKGENLGIPSPSTAGGVGLIGNDHLVARLDQPDELEVLAAAGAGPATLEVAVTVELWSGGAEKRKSSLRRSSKKRRLPAANAAYESRAICLRSAMAGRV
jgi:short subunit dehydrogenase